MVRSRLALPSDLEWQQEYALQFGNGPAVFADLYYDAANLLIRDLQQVSTIGIGGTLVVNRAALARAVRNTTRYQGVSCTITLDPSTGNRLDDPSALSRCGRALVPAPQRAPGPISDAVRP